VALDGVVIDGVAIEALLDKVGGKDYSKTPNRNKRTRVVMS
jgi:hypothetical protein